MRDRALPASIWLPHLCGDGRSVAQSSAHCLGSRCPPAGAADGNMVSYIARASRIKRARSRSDFGMNRTTSPNLLSKTGTLRQHMLTTCQTIRPSLEARDQRSPERRQARRPRRLRTSMKSALPIALWLTLALCSPAFAQLAPAAPAEMISNYRLQHGEGRVTPDSTLNRIAHDQADAMASKDVLDHGVLGPFSSRVAASKAERAAENIAYGHDGFAKTLGQWIDSPEHRKNLLMHGASKVGVASAKSTTSGRTYWAMVIAGGYERSRPPPRPAKPPTSHHAERPCRIKLLGLCL